MRHMFRAIKRVLDEHDDVKAIYPIHMNPLVRETAAHVFSDDDRIRLINPLDVLDFHNILKCFRSPLISSWQLISNRLNVCSGKMRKLLDIESIIFPTYFINNRIPGIR